MFWLYANCIYSDSPRYDIQSIEGVQKSPVTVSEWPGSRVKKYPASVGSFLKGAGTKMGKKIRPARVGRENTYKYVFEGCRPGLLGSGGNSDQPNRADCEIGVLPKSTDRSRGGSVGEADFITGGDISGGK